MLVRNVRKSKIFKTSNIENYSVLFLYELPFYAMAGLDQLLKFYLCFQWQKNLRVPLVKFFICITSSETHSSFMTQPLSSLSSSGCIPSTTSWMEAGSTSRSHLLLLELHSRSIHILQSFAQLSCLTVRSQHCLELLESGCKFHSSILNLSLQFHQMV